jgi:chemotaxis protein CheZ
MAKMTAEQLQSEIEKIAMYISQAKLEIAAISLPDEQSGTDKNIAHAALELAEVVRHTEAATNTIMDNAEAIMKLSGDIKDAKVSEKMNEHVAGIMEACSFQDITGQRINKVLKTLQQIEARVGNLVKLFGGTLPDGFVVGEIEIGGHHHRPDEKLLNGPQLGKDAPNQSDIDKLFSAS